MTAKLAAAVNMRDGDGQRTGAYDVLVLDALLKQSLAAVRGLGKAGLRVAAGESAAHFDTAVPLPAFRSRYCARALVLPDLVTDPSAFVAAVLRFARDYRPRVILPTGDSTIAVLRGHRAELAELGCVLALASEAALDIANDKDRTLSLAARLGIGQPKSLRIDNVDGLRAAVREFGFPFVLKPTVSWPGGGSGDRLVPVDVIDLAEATEVTTRILGSGAGVLAQQLLTGRREGVSLFVADGAVLAACGHVAHRSAPPLGGASTVRESILPPRDILDPAVRLVRAMGLEGACEVEFRRDARNRALLMEVNARLAGTIENATRSGVNFPALIWRWAVGQEIAPVAGQRVGVRTRWLHGDLRWLRQNWQRTADRPDGMSRARSLYAFGAEFFKTRHYDYFDRSDPKPFITELRYSMRALKKRA